MSFTIYRLDDPSLYSKVAEVTDDATVVGDDHDAAVIRDAFEIMRDAGYEPANHLTAIRDRIEANYETTGYYLVE